MKTFLNDVGNVIQSSDTYFLLYKYQIRTVAISSSSDVNHSNPSESRHQRNDKSLDTNCMIMTENLIPNCFLCTAQDFVHDSIQSRDPYRTIISVDQVRIESHI